MKRIQSHSSISPKSIFLGLIAILMLHTRVSSQTNPVPQPMPYTQDFGNNWFTISGLPQGFATWTASGAPRTSNTSAAVSIASGDDTGFDSATVVKSTGKSYGYSGIGSNGVQINNGQLYIQTSSATSGTDQLVLAINSTGYSAIRVSFDVEMINPQPKLTGFVFQFRIGTTGAFTTVDSSYWHNSADRHQNQVDNFINLLLPASADNQPLIQLRWALSRDILPAGAGSSGLAFDNIIVTGDQATGQKFFRSIATGNWNSPLIWESSPDSITWMPATGYPSSAEHSIDIRSPHTVYTTGISNLVVDELIIEQGATLWNAYGTLMSINDGPGAVDLDIYGTFVDSSNYSVVIPVSASWRIAPNATLIKTTNTSSTIWQLRYYNGIANIPATSNWICRKPPGSIYEPSISSTNGGPPYPQVYYGNLYIENNSASWNPNNLCKFSGFSNYPVVKGNLYIGGNAGGNVNFFNANTHSSPLKVCGNIYIKTGSTFSVTGTGVEVQGNMQCNGSYTHAGSGSKLLFSGASLQSVNGTGSINTYRMEVNKTFGDLSLYNSISVFGNLNLLNGIVYTSQANKVIVKDNATATMASNLSFISGPIQKIGDDIFTFPVGKGNDYQPVGINVGSGATTTDAFTAEYFYINPQMIYGNNLAPGLHHISSCEYWIVESDAGNAHKNVTLTWDAHSCGVTNLSTLRVARFNSALWVDEGNTGTTGTQNSGTITSNVTTGYGPFTLASVTTDNPLPLSLLSFTADYNGKEVNLNWVTASEVNNLYFAVERSTDGKTWKTLFTQTAAGNSTSVIEYQMTDKNPVIGISYYRLRQNDFDGRMTYSNIVPIRIEREKLVLLSFYASRHNMEIKFDINFPYNVTGNIDITDMNGRQVLSNDFSAQARLEHFSLVTPALKPGVYYMRVNYNDDVIVRKFIY